MSATKTIMMYIEYTNAFMQPQVQVGIDRILTCMYTLHSL